MNTYLAHEMRDESKTKTRVPEPTSQVLPTERRLMRMVEQNGGKFESFWNIMKDSRFVQIEHFFGRCSLGDVKNRMRN